jgi:hypothetical protein
VLVDRPAAGQKPNGISPEISAREQAAFNLFYRVEKKAFLVVAGDWVLGGKASFEITVFRITHM